MLSGFGNSFGTYIGGRLWTGYALRVPWDRSLTDANSIACSIFQVTAAPLIAEIAHPRFRAVVTGSFLSTYFIGSIVVGWLGFGFVYWDSEWAWRVATILQCLGCVPIVFWCFTPWMAESPRYLIKQGQQERAMQILAAFHANGDTTDELVVNEFKEIVLAVELDREAEKTTYMDFFRTPGNKKRFWLVCWTAWITSMAGVGDTARLRGHRSSTEQPSSLLSCSHPCERRHHRLCQAARHQCRPKRRCMVHRHCRCPSI